MPWAAPVGPCVRAPETVLTPARSDRLSAAVEQHDVRPGARRDGNGVHARDSRPDDDHPGRRHSRDTADDHSPTTLDAGQALGTHQRGKAARDLTHREQQRERAIWQLDRLVRDGCRPGRHEGPCIPGWPRGAGR